MQHTFQIDSPHACVHAGKETLKKATWTIVKQYLLAWSKCFNAAGIPTSARKNGKFQYGIGRAVIIAGLTSTDDMRTVLSCIPNARSVST